MDLRVLKVDGGASADDFPRAVFRRMCYDSRSTVPPVSSTSGTGEPLYLAGLCSVGE